MKIGIISDTHDNLDYFDKAIEFFNSQRVELVLHAGDMVSPFAIMFLRKLNCKSIVIFGNNEGEKIALNKLAQELGVSIHPGPYEYKFNQKNILLMHEPYVLRSASLSGCYDLVVYGHTHLPDIRRVNGCLIVNPGECCGYVNGQATVGIVNLADMSAKIYLLDDLSEILVKEVS